MVVLLFLLLLCRDGDPLLKQLMCWRIYWWPGIRVEHWAYATRIGVTAVATVRMPTHIGVLIIWRTVFDWHWTRVMLTRRSDVLPTHCDVYLLTMAIGGRVIVVCDVSWYARYDDIPCRIYRLYSPLPLTGQRIDVLPLTTDVTVFDWLPGWRVTLSMVLWHCDIYPVALVLCGNIGTINGVSILSQRRPAWLAWPVGRISVA